LQSIGICCRVAVASNWILVRLITQNCTLFHSKKTAGFHQFSRYLICASYRVESCKHAVPFAPANAKHPFFRAASNKGQKCVFALPCKTQTPTARDTVQTTSYRTLVIVARQKHLQKETTYTNFVPAGVYKSVDFFALGKTEACEPSRLSRPTKPHCLQHQHKQTNVGLV
jgi:hypothetical protein